MRKYVSEPATQSTFVPPSVQIQTRPFAPPQVQQSSLPPSTESFQTERGSDSEVKQSSQENLLVGLRFSDDNRGSTRDLMQRKWEGIIQRVKDGSAQQTDPNVLEMPERGSTRDLMQRKWEGIVQRYKANRSENVANTLPLQAKLAIGEPNDKYEQEADSVALKVVRQINEPSSSQSLQGKSIQRHSQAGEEEIQTKSFVQRRASVNGGEASEDLETSIQQVRGSGQALDPNLQQKMGQAMGADFSGVKVHTDSQSDQLNQSIQAKAFTTGQDIFFRQGEYEPGSRGGQELIAHELTHVVQQNGGAVQRHQDEDEVQMKPDLQLHQDEDEVQMKPSLQLHQDEDEVQMKPDLQRMEASNTSGGCQCLNCAPMSVTVQRRINNGSQNLLNRKLTDMVQQEGRQIQRSSGSAHCVGCSCHNCGTTGMKVQRQSDTEHGAGCSCPTCSHGEKIQTKPMIQRHREEESIQAKPISTQITPTAQQSTNSSVIQRHSSWEHQLLGDAQPTDLAKIGTWQELIELTKEEVKEKRAWYQKDIKGPKNARAEIEIEGVGTINKGNVMHVIAQELQRLDQWQKNPPQKGTSGEVDATYQTVLVAIPGGGKDGKSPLVITYGEMNTLADYYGSVDVMKAADPKVRWQVIQSVRKETFLKLSEIYSKLKSSLTEQEKTDRDVTDSEEMMSNNTIEKTFFNRNKFADAFEADLISAKAGQITLLKMGGAGASGTNEYSATLARNACHFVPESWHAWASYHKIGLAEAKKAWDLKEEAEDDLKQASDLEAVEDLEMPEYIVGNLQEEAAEKTEQAEEAANEAILNNGFGDHYLQDSYAAGHMINKTKIMQWFVQWLDTKQYNMDFSTDENWRKVQAIAYKQPEIASAMQYDKTQVQGYNQNQTENRAQNPQAVEDKDGSWQERFNALGLQVPKSLQTPGTPSRILMEWWQTFTGNGGARELLGDAFKCQLDFPSLKEALKDLMADGIVSYTHKSAAETGKQFLSGQAEFNTSMNMEDFISKKFALRKEYVPRDMEKFIQARDSHELEESDNDDSQYQSMAAAVTYQDYMAFMNNAYVQKSTNALHDVFCKDGLEVKSGGGEDLFKVYGDDSMFNSQSALGVKHSGETAKMSLNSIRNMITTGQEGNDTTAAILNRLPSMVKPPGTTGPAISIEAWHNPSQVGNLKKYCEDNIFPNMGVIDKAVGATGDLTSFISKDKTAVHGSDAF